MHPIFRSAAALLLALGLASPLAAQTSWPEKPVKLVVGFTAGSATDVTARLFAQKFSEAWGQPVVVENVAGNSGAIGVDRVAKAAPDGYTLMWSGNAAITILPSLQTLPFDPVRDFAPISTSLSMPSVFVVNNDMPIKSMADLIAYAKANPGKLSYGTPGVGTPQPILDKVRAESLKVLADPEMVKKFAVMGLDIVGSTSAETRAAIEGDIPKWGKVIKEAGIKPAN